MAKSSQDLHKFEQKETRKGRLLRVEVCPPMSMLFPDPLDIFICLRTRSAFLLII